MKTAKQILVEAKALIVDPKNWTQGMSARNSDGNYVDPEDDKAVCFCAVGALAHASDTGNQFFNNGTPGNVAYWKLMDAANKLGAPTIVHLNDAEVYPNRHNPRRPPEEAHAKVLEAFDLAITSADEA